MPYLTPGRGILFPQEEWGFGGWENAGLDSIQMCIKPPGNPIL